MVEETIEDLQKDRGPDLHPRIPGRDLGQETETMTQEASQGQDRDPLADMQQQVADLGADLVQDHDHDPSQSRLTYVTNTRMT